MLMRSWIWTPLLLVILAAGSYAAYRWLAPPTLPDGFLYGGGRIEGTEVTVASEVSARVLDSVLVEGAEVQRGQELVRLDTQDLQTQLERVGLGDLGRQALALLAIGATLFGSAVFAFRR